MRRRCSAALVERRGCCVLPRWWCCGGGGRYARHQITSEEDAGVFYTLEFPPPPSVVRGGLEQTRKSRVSPSSLSQYFIESMALASADVSQRCDNEKCVSGVIVKRETLRRDGRRQSNNGVHWPRKREKSWLVVSRVALSSLFVFLFFLTSRFFPFFLPPVLCHLSASCHPPHLRPKSIPSQCAGTSEVGGLVVVVDGGAVGGEFCHLLCIHSPQPTRAGGGGGASATDGRLTEMTSCVRRASGAAILYYKPLG